MLDDVIGVGRYRLGRPLGRGGMAQVRLGLDVSTGHAVAVKHLTGELVSNAHARRLFSAEVTTTAALEHPGVVRVLDSGEAMDRITGISTPYFVMEFVPGDPLCTLTRQGKPVSVEQSLRLTRQLLDVLAYCHDAGLVHGDIKPANVLVSPTGGVKLVDFGVARSVGELCQTGPASRPVESAADDRPVPHFVTMKYASPEQMQQLPVDARSDLYSVGCVLYELLTGRPPFAGEPEKLLAHHLFDRPSMPSEYSSAVTSDIDAIVLRALQKYPQDRYPSAAVMIEDIDRALEAVRARSSVPALPAVSATESTTWPARAVVAGAQARKLHQRRLVRGVSALAAALLPVAGFGAFHLRGPVPVGSVSGALSVEGVVEARNGTRGSLTTTTRPGAHSAAGRATVLQMRGAALPLNGATSGAGLDGSGRRASAPVDGGQKPDVASVRESAGAAAAPEIKQPKSRRPAVAQPRGPASGGSGSKPDNPKPDNPKPDNPKQDNPKPNNPKPNNPKPNNPKPNKPEQPRPDRPKSDLPKPDKPDKPDKPEKRDKPDAAESNEGAG
ncbi:MAG TPA: serine/threonine-protein kinase [Microlunatus sp.]|nr:serine/threonine-protein kinase [Microlunatus sp.]